MGLVKIMRGWINVWGEGTHYSMSVWVLTTVEILICVCVCVCVGGCVDKKVWDRKSLIPPQCRGMPA